MAPPSIYSDAVQGETFLPRQIFVFGGFELRANLLGHLEQIDSDAPGLQVRFGSLNCVVDICGDLIFVEFRVPAYPLGSNTRVRAEISPSTYLHLAASLGSKLRKEQHKGHKIYTGSGHHCGVIPYSSLWCVDCL